MQLIDKLDSITAPFANAVITIGNFDGVHIGHQALFYEVIERAAAIAGTSIAMTFEPHPLRLLRQNALPPLITPFEQKLELIERSGMDVLICVPFTNDFAAIPAGAFVEDLLVRRIGMKAIVVGEDYAFGRDREGNIDLLRSLSARLGFEVIVTGMIRSVRGLSERVSSTAIRSLLSEGEVDKAHRMLGRHYQVRGEVVAGRGRGGRLLGIPTANLKLSGELCPKTGIYAVRVEVNRRAFQGVANIGYSPTFDDHLFTVEIHILDFDEAIYGERIRVSFVQRIRDEMKFPSPGDLKRQIEADIRAARKLFAASNSH
jgi:riboflavin kinase/FMN adenylyltransferase